MKEIKKNNPEREVRLMTKKAVKEKEILKREIEREEKEDLIEKEILKREIGISRGK